jgi:hypothetical protein
MKTKDDILYDKYVAARKHTWRIHDKLVRTGQFRKDHPDYLRACEAEHKAYAAHLNAEEAEEAIKKFKKEDSHD